MAGRPLSAEIIALLNDRAHLYNKAGFIESDPVSVPHRFSDARNIEIAGFLTAVISWGQRPQIIRNAIQLMALMDNDPYHFLLHSQDTEMQRFSHFYYRTFNGDDCMFFIRRLRKLYRQEFSIRQVFEQGYRSGGNVKEAIIHFRSVFMEGYIGRTHRHLSDPSKGSAAKRLNMYLRWMVRKDANGVDFGLWKEIPPSALYMPLDVHSGNVARKLGLLHRKSNDWKAVEELTGRLRTLDQEDPVKYDFALFGMGVFEKF